MVNNTMLGCKSKKSGHNKVPNWFGRLELWKACFIWPKKETNELTLLTNLKQKLFIFLTSTKTSLML